MALFVLAGWAGGVVTAFGQAYPPPPQTPATANGVEPNGEARIPGGSTGFVDPSPWGYCRYVTNGNALEVAFGISSAAEWQYFRAGEFNGQTPPGVTEVVCCRPTTATLCQGASGGARVAPLNGAGVNGYGVYNSTGSATATCSNPPYGTYQDTRTFTCGQVGAGVDADGQWSPSGGDSDSCTPNSYVVYGGCSASCGGGNLYETLYNSCGQVTSQGYFGPSCNTQSCCTPSYSCGSCNQSTGTKTCTDVACGSGSYQTSCSYGTWGGGSCSPYPPNSYSSCIATDGNISTPETCGGEQGCPSTWGYWGAGQSGGCGGGLATNFSPPPPGVAGTTSFTCTGYE